MQHESGCVDCFWIAESDRRFEPIECWLLSAPLLPDPASPMKSAREVQDYPVETQLQIGREAMESLLPSILVQVPVRYRSVTYALGFEGKRQLPMMALSVQGLEEEVVDLAKLIGYAARLPWVEPSKPVGPAGVYAVDIQLNGDRQR
jgi:hypothetical protein